eukprot:TRINITY_DN459_c0_g1_i3.p1 TRINITY_DN459_c0_g1~~TRINITY_DN459_c0_g1_i3.p1  ORF type:complete len:203 (+),score=31.44 TRINITY_DN459_c0_g1_i3:667-1275(+)
MRDEIIKSLVQIHTQNVQLIELKIEHEAQTMLAGLNKMKQDLKVYQPLFTPSQSDFTPLHRLFLALKKITAKEIITPTNNNFNNTNSIVNDIVDSLISKTVELKIEKSDQPFVLDIKDRLCFNILYDEEKGLLSFSTRCSGFVTRIEISRANEKEYLITPKDFYFKNSKSWSNMNESEILCLNPEKFITDTLWPEIDSRKKR